MGQKGKLYICGTPLGNLEDISLRAIKTLKSVDLIAAEDTRRSQQLLNHLQINTPLTSYHEHNEEDKTPFLINKLQEGKDLALVSNGGMPGISDPGLTLMQAVIKAGLELIPVPGPTALISALLVSGMATDRFVFEGFLPRKGRKREARLDEIAREVRTIIIYESPNRLLQTLEEFVPLLKERSVAVVREISKVYEEKLYGSSYELLEEIKKRGQIKGEIVIVIAGKERNEEEPENWEGLTVLEHVKLLIEYGLTKKEAIKEVAKIRDLKKNQVYKEAIVLDYKEDKGN